MERSLHDIHKWTDVELFSALGETHTVAERAFTEIYNRYNKKLFAYILRITGNMADSKDIFQETFIRFFNYSKKPRRIDNILLFLIKIARNLCINRLRDSKETISIDKFQIASEIDKEDENEHLAEIISKALSILDLDVREIFVLHHYQGLTFVDIADITGVSLASVKSKYYRAKEKLRKTLEPMLKNMY